jgi:hypothetical protein
MIATRCSFHLPLQRRESDKLSQSVDERAFTIGGYAFVSNTSIMQLQIFVLTFFSNYGSNQ